MRQLDFPLSNPGGQKEWEKREREREIWWTCDLVLMEVFGPGAWLRCLFVQHVYCPACRIQLGTHKQAQTQRSSSCWNTGRQVLNVVTHTHKRISNFVCHRSRVHLRTPRRTRVTGKRAKFAHPEPQVPKWIKHSFCTRSFLAAIDFSLHGIDSSVAACERTGRSPC